MNVLVLLSTLISIQIFIKFQIFDYTVLSPSSLHNVTPSCLSVNQQNSIITNITSTKPKFKGKENIRMSKDMFCSNTIAPSIIDIPMTNGTFIFHTLFLYTMFIFFE